VRKRLSTLSIWLGLFAMLMIHVGPLYSALTMAPPPAASANPDPQHHHDHHAHHEQSASAHGHHRQPRAGEPEWLAALELCGYCELLTLNPPLLFAVTLMLPRPQPVQVQPLPGTPIAQVLRHSGSHARAPPVQFPS